MKFLIPEPYSLAPIWACGEKAVENPKKQE
jgi:hypothetical protein